MFKPPIAAKKKYQILTVS